jgi:hypothetical protein
MSCGQNRSVKALGHKKLKFKFGISKLFKGNNSGNIYGIINKFELDEILVMCLALFFYCKQFIPEICYSYSLVKLIIIRITKLC